MNEESTDEQEELICACQQPLPDLARLGVEYFNQGRYFEAHEELELAWRAESGPIRNLYQGILQIGVAYYQITRNNYRGARKMFLRGRAALINMPDQCQGIDLVQFQKDYQQAEQLLIRLGAENIDHFDRRYLRPVPFANTQGD